ncbi:MAG TPA: xanthine dehydrogenase family protein molybdopterin-binding subunit [Candidatus Binatia bacterium]|nr:xanthine dehydrogenase family protein molybdopterin-binding subunit [Candidatus Binatia bacterium]
MSSTGQSLTMIDAEERVTGRINYALNIERPGMLHGRILRSPFPHARLKHIDASVAERVPGVAAVLTRDDFAEASGYSAKYGRIFRDQSVVALDKVRFIGDPVAAVAALTDEIAEEALSLIRVDYEELPAVFDEHAALQPEAPLVHDPRPAQQAIFSNLIQDLPSGSNLCSHFKLRHGDVEAGFRQADFVFEDVFRSPAAQHVPLEPHVTVAEFFQSKLTLWSSTQMPHAVRAQMAELLHLPLSQVRVIVETLGGGFGSKGSLRLEPTAAFLARKAERPVKIVLRREEEFVTVCKHPATIRLKTGVNKDGRLIARQVTAHFNTGAYSDVGPVVARNGGSAMSGPYKIPHVHIDSYAVWTNLVPAGALRGFGVPQAVWAYESQMDMIAERLGVDPVELRRKNLLRDGDSFATGEKLAHMQLDELLDKASGDLQWQASDARWSSHNHIPGPTGATRRGKGLALVIKATITPSTSTAAIKLNEDGSLNLLVSSVECGQGAKTVLAQIAADAMQVPVERVAVSNPDTDVTPYDQQTSSSRTTFSMGGAVTQAAADLRQQLLDHAAVLLEASARDLLIENGRVSVRGTPNRFLPYGAVAMRSQQANLIGCGAFTTRGGLDLEMGQGIGSVHWHQGAIGCEVEVDAETGKVKVLRLSPSVFAGRVVNPRLCELQLEGCAIFGLGQALFEEMVYAERGQLLNSNLGDYNIPSFEDIAPLINASALEHPASDDLHGIGETLLPPVMAAIGNAVYNAIGVRIQDLPLTPEKILREMHKKASRESHMSPSARG